MYERQGGSDRIQQIANDIIDSHFVNSKISKIFAAIDEAKLKKGATDFMISGTGGPNVY